MARSPLRRAAPAAAALLLGGCSTLGNWLTPPGTSSGIPLPGRMAAVDAAEPIQWPDPHWWRGFGSAELDGLMAEAMAANNDIAAAVARIRQADAQIRIAGATLLPTLDLTTRATRSQSGSASSASIAGFGGGGSRIRVSSNDQLTFSASYEIDFWGKNRGQVEAAQQSASATRFDAGTVTLTTQASVANTYFAVLSAQETLEIQRQNLVIAQRVLRVIRQRVAVGTATGLDLAQQETVVAQQQAQIPPLVQELEQNRNSLGTLVARPPETVRLEGGVFNRLAVPKVTPGLPAEVLARRPDVLNAEAALAAANANIVVARAQLLPSVTLTGTGGFSSLALENLLRPGSVIFNIAGGLVQPIFRGGALRGQVELNEGRAQELLALYRNAILNALVDAENALVALRQTTEQEALQSNAVRMAERAYNISEAQLEAGTIDQVTLLNTQQTLFSARVTLADARLARLQAAVALFRALGGGWTGI
ncbi:efflux transporter outer membrane subunit [Belnapia rosea]|uniref:Efflux transporter, outer membrane factor (OMF) lipoprotein, NodT family n=1 Tax=Belnapia rosea TaxID=938405 RepID=A0A1G6M8Y4_9PROT|nr:efflux transporter outer membrane subunit [Belnapia rosea]SDB43810.1 efflux transporter, outer membrane factor (OMF) lipoprotein, NodT family [Belnapia rosea]SDC51963.1 efflux transporter, outer membrane factor (OMF) lipoprotein, NodT family [Belnapia rosea]